MTFIDEEFLLRSKSASRLYHEYAEQQPVLDYHNHLPPKDIADNRRFNNLFEIWLEGDHYKWRAMRANGVSEQFITGNADPRDKFLSWAETVPATLRNPLYHWTHLELKRYFGITELLNEQSAKRIWDQASEQLQTPELQTHGILAKFKVAALCTTDDPVDDLSYHQSIAGSRLKTRVLPAFRPDKSLAVNLPDAFNAWTERLASASNVSIESIADFLEALGRRHDYFHAAGCRLSDHGLAKCFADFPSDNEASKIFDNARRGIAASPDEHAKFASYLMLHFGRLDARRGWTKQLHLGALRNVRTKGFTELGPDTGFDSIGDYSQAALLGAYLDQLDREGALPKTIIYNNNPNDNYIFSTMAGNFQDGSVPGKIQFGSGWWYLDAKDGIRWQLDALSNNGLLARFIGMLTDSRSFMSYPRHEYFRRLLCNVLGEEMENGELPDDFELVGGMVEDICYRNVREYLNLPGVGASQL